MPDDGGAVSLWDVLHRRPVGTLRSAGTSQGIDALAFDARGAQLASLSGGTITVWNVAAERPAFTLRWGGNGTVRFSPDGGLLAAAGEDGTITLWDTASRELLGTLRGQNPRGIHPEVAFANYGRTMASVVGGGGLMLWDLSVEGWTKAACAVGNRDLSRAEWERYVGRGFAPRSMCRSTFEVLTRGHEEKGLRRWFAHSRPAHPDT